jgi:hypothetical protein
VYQIASVDGRVAITPDIPLFWMLEKWRQIDGEAAGFSPDPYQWIQEVHQPQMYMEGSNSFVKRDQKRKPLPSVKEKSTQFYQHFLPEEILKDPRLKAWGAVVDSQGRGRNWLDWVAPECHILLLVASRTPVEYLAYLQRKNIPYLIVGEQRVDLPLALETMQGMLGVICVCSTGWGQLNGALLRQKLVDEINIIFYPAIVGGMDTPALFDSPDLKESDWPTRLKLLSLQTVAEGHIWMRYKVLYD